MIAAVTGGTGFIGRALVERLVGDGHFSEVRVLTRRGAAPVGGLAVRGDLEKDPLEPLVEGAAVLFHCAGELEREEAMRGLHVEATRRLIEAARGRVARWVQLSSVGAYGRRLREGVVDESSPLAPEGQYETTKAESDRLVAQAAAAGAFACVTLRPAIVFGPGMRNRSLEQLVGAVEKGLFFFIGRGAVANYVYAEDVAQALAACAGAPGGALYNLSDDRPMEAFIGAIAKALGRPVPRRRLPEGVARAAARLGRVFRGFPLTEARVDALSRRVRYPSERIRRELGFSFGVSIEEGLRRFVAGRRARQ